MSTEKEAIRCVTTIRQRNDQKTLYCTVTTLAEKLEVGKQYLVTLEAVEDL